MTAARVRASMLGQQLEGEMETCRCGEAPNEARRRRGRTHFPV